MFSLFLYFAKCSLVKIESERYHKSNGHSQQEIRYYISCLPADAAKINAAIRQHWEIKNQLHWTLDVAFGEVRARRGQVTQRRIFH